MFVTPYNDAALSAQAAANASAIADLEAETETGTFTPVIQGAGVSGTNFASQTGFYEANSHSVKVWGRVLWSKASGSDAAIEIGGLPFASSADLHSVSVGPVMSDNYTGPGVPMLRMDAGATTARIKASTGEGALGDDFNNGQTVTTEFFLEYRR